MPTVQPFPAGGYRFITHQLQYSGGVATEPGFCIRGARFPRPVPLAEGFDAIEAYLGGVGRSPTAFCACELRSLAQFTDARCAPARTRALALSQLTAESERPPFVTGSEYDYLGSAINAIAFRPTSCSTRSGF